MNLSEAINKHTDWKIKLRSAINNGETIDATALSRDSACELGKWLHGEGMAKFSRCASFSNCASAHAGFHVEAGKVATVINAKRYDEAKQMIAPGSKFAEATSIVIDALAKLQKEAA